MSLRVWIAWLTAKPWKQISKCGASTSHTALHLLALGLGGTVNVSSANTYKNVLRKKGLRDINHNHIGIFVVELRFGQGRLANSAS